jgi:dTDP-4-dehydrorhamnose reductase
MTWLIGCNGMLGTELSHVLEKNEIPFIGTDCEVDITDLSALESFAKNKNFCCIINCAAYTAVDKAEDDIQTCNKLNIHGAANIAACSKNINARLIHISTDYVFDGKGITEENVLRSYREDDKTNPIGVYGLSKRDGEIAVLENNQKSYIIRTAWLYGKYRNNFVSAMIRLMNEKNEIKVVNDQVGSPTWAFDLSNAIINFINTETSCGIYHYTNEGNITWFDFANEIYKLGKETGLIKNKCNVVPCSSSEYPSKVQRPSFSVLDKSKIKNNLKISIPSWNKSLKEYINTCAL